MGFKLRGVTKSPFDPIGPFCTAQHTPCQELLSRNLKEKRGIDTNTNNFKTALVTVVPKAKVTIKGPTKSWAGKGSSGKDVHRIFCSECGSPIAHDPDAAPEIIAIKAGTLDTEIKRNLKPDTEIWTQSKLPWMKESLAKPFKGMPE